MKDEQRVNLYSQNLCQVWLRFVYERGDDLVPRSAAGSSIGKMHNWYADEDLEIILNPTWFSEDSGQGWVFTATWLNWCLRHGIAPGQAFQLSVDEPTYYRTSWEYNEWDAAWNFEITSIENWSEKTIVQSWSRILEARSRYVETATVKMRELNEKRKTDISAMYLIRDRYYVPGGYHEGMWPNGAMIKLCTRHTTLEGITKYGNYELLRGADDGGSDENAMTALEKLAYERLNLSPTTIRLLPLEYR